MALLQAANFNPVCEVSHGWILVSLFPELTFEYLHIDSPPSIPQIVLNNPVTQVLELITFITDRVTNMTTWLNYFSQFTVHCTEELGYILAVKRFICGQIARQRVVSMREYVNLYLLFELDIPSVLQLKQAVHIVLHEVIERPVIANNEKLAIHIQVQSYFLS